MILTKVENLLVKLHDEDDRQFVRELLEVAEQARAHVEMGQGSYKLVKAVAKVYEPEIVSLKNWTK